MTILSAEEMERYARHLSLSEVGLAGQEKLKKARVLLIGAGGIGSPAAYYLAAAGVGNIGIIDHDLVDRSNLQRQILFTTEDIGKSKAEIAKLRISALNPNIHATAYPLHLTSQNAHRIIADYDVVLDGSDNYQTRYLVGDVTAELRKPLVSSSIYQFIGQLGVFNVGGGPCYRCLYPEPPPEKLIPNCAEAGVLGVTAGVMGSLAANEIIKLILGMGAPLSENLLMFDSLRGELKKYSIARHPECLICEKHQAFSSLPRYDEPSTCKAVPEVTPIQLKALMGDESVVLLDVRELWEREISQIHPSLHIPLGDIVETHLPFSVNQSIVVYCKVGVRSLHAAKILRQLGYTNVSHLEGGIMAWSLTQDG